MSAAYRDSIQGVGSGSTITVSSTGLTFSENDVLVFHVWGFTTLGAPSGGNTTWTQEATVSGLDPFSADITHRVYTGVAGATITNFTVSNGVADEFAWSLTSVSGADTATPEDGTAGASFQNFGAQPVPTAPAITTTGTDSLLVCSVGAMTTGDVGTTFASVGGVMTQREAIGGYYDYAVFTEALVSSGDTGTRTFTESPAHTASNYVWNTTSIAIKSAAGGGDTTLTPGVGSVPLTGLLMTVVQAMSNTARIIFRKA